MAQEAVSALLREKRNVQRQLVETRRGMLRANQQAGVLTGYEFTRENLELLKIELELADTPAARRDVLENMLKAARMIEDAKQAAQREGTGDFTEILQAKVQRLNIQIQLEEAKSKK